MMVLSEHFKNHCLTVIDPFDISEFHDGVLFLPFPFQILFQILEGLVQSFEMVLDKVAEISIVKLSMDEGLLVSVLRLVDDPVLASWGIRFLIVNNYLAFYTIDKEKQTVIVVRFLYQKSNWNVILRQGFSLI